MSCVDRLENIADQFGKVYMWFLFQSDTETNSSSSYGLGIIQVQIESVCQILFADKVLLIISRGKKYLEIYAPCIPYTIQAFVVFIWSLLNTNSPFEF